MSHLIPGLCYDVSDSLGGYLITSGDAEEVGGDVAAVDPNDESAELPVYGGISVQQPIEAAADKTADTARQRRRPRK